MKYKYRTFIKFVLAAVMISSSYSGQIRVCQAEEVSQKEKTASPYVPEPVKESASSQNPDKAKERSPFNPTALIEDHAAWGGDATQSENGYARWKPNIIVRGFIEIEGKPAAALLEVNGEAVYFVKKGDQISVQQGTNTINLTVHEIRGSEVLVKIMPLDRIVPLR